jgi:hypothetical protein
MAPRMYVINSRRCSCCPSGLDGSGPGPFLYPYPDQIAVWADPSAAAGLEFLAARAYWAVDPRLEIEYP